MIICDYIDILIYVIFGGVIGLILKNIIREDRPNKRSGYGMPSVHAMMLTLLCLLLYSKNMLLFYGSVLLWYYYYLYKIYNGDHTHLQYLCGTIIIFYLYIIYHEFCIYK